MPETVITTSGNIASLNSKVLASLCDGKFHVDLQPTVYIGSGALNVLGGSIKITSPTGVIIKNYSTSGYDISGGSPAMQGVVEVNIPKQGGTYQYGTYIVDARLTDEDGTNYFVSKSVKLCEPDKAHKTRNYGTLSAKLEGVCRDGKLFVTADTPPNYKGVEVDSQVNDFKLIYPTVSELDPIEDITISSFSAPLYEGVYIFSGTICATYNAGDYLFYEVLYNVKREKDIKCIIDECCIFGKLEELHEKLNSKCTQDEINELSAIAVDTLRLWKTANLAAQCGEDPSDYIADLEKLLGCKCTCNCNEGTPIINNSPAKDFVFAGCGFTKTTVGLTDYITFNNYGYLIDVPDNGGVLTVGSLVAQGCTVTIPLNFDYTQLYTQIKKSAITDFNFWAAIVNKSWNSIDPTCLGITTIEWQLMTFLQKGQALANAACSGGSCAATISDDVAQVNGSDVELQWVENSGVPYSVEIYVDDVLAGTVLGGNEAFVLVGKADGNTHSYSIIAKCSNGVAGNALDGTFNFFGCPNIAAPTVSLSSVSDADCPYDLQALVNALPSGIEAEWHSANNTNPSSLVADPTNAITGVYYVFAKNGNNCYSLGTKVTLVCSVETNCSAPQNLTVLAINDGFKVSFESAAYPPPAGSYTVKRKLASAPDVDGSYTTIGTPTYNASAFRWEILDETAAENTLYTYKAISNCSLSAPAVTYNYAHFTCPALTLTTGNETVSYSFTNAGGEIDKYEVSIYDSTGTTLIHTNTHTPAFPSPIVGTFVYLDNGQNYKVRLKIFIGAYSNTICPLNSISTANFTVQNESSLIVNSVTPSGNYTVISGSFPIAVSGSPVVGTHTSFTAAFAVAGVSAPGPWEVRLYKNDVLLETVSSIATSATLTFASVTFTSTDNIVISINDTV